MHETVASSPVNKSIASRQWKGDQKMMKGEIELEA